MGNDTLEQRYSILMQVAMNCSYCIAMLLTKDIPTAPGSLWLWIPPMSTDIRVLCYPWNCRRDTLCFSSGRAASPPLSLTLGQPKAFRQHFARGEHSLSNSPDEFQAIIGYDHTAGRCCLYRVVVRIDLPIC